MADRSDVMAHFNKLQAEKEQQNAQQQKRQEAEEAESLAANARAHRVFEGVVVPAINAAKRALSTQNVNLETTPMIKLGSNQREANRVEFYLCRAGDEDRPDRPHTRRYNISLRDDGTVIVGRRSDRNTNSENLTSILGSVSATELTGGYVDEVVKLAVTEWFEVKDQPTARPR